MWALEFVDYSTLLLFVVPVLGCHKKGFSIVGPLEVYLYSLVVACPFTPLPLSLYVWYHYEDVLAVGVAVACSTITVIVVGLIEHGMLSIVDVVFAVQFML